jgi:hypothetical protein
MADPAALLVPALCTAVLELDRGTAHLSTPFGCVKVW